MTAGLSGTAQTEQRQLAAIMFTDIVGFSRQMGSNEARTLRLLDTHNQLIQEAVADHHGQVIKTAGDGFLIEFPSVVQAVQCAQQIQRQLHTHNANKAGDEQIHIRIGIHLGDILQRDGDVFGDGVNIASRLQEAADPDTICISDVVYRDVAKKLDLGAVVALGRPKLKNIAERFPVYALLHEPPKGVRQQLQVQRLKLSRRLRPVMFVLVFVGMLALGGSLFLLSPSFLPLSTQDSALRTDAAPAALPLPDKPSIAVLPFTNMSGDPEQEYFSDGLTEDLTADLSKLPGLFVIARNSAFTYKGKAVKVQDVSKELGVRYVLEGSVRKSENQVRIRAQLIDATTGYHLWTERYDRPLQDLFTLQDEIRQQIMTALRIEVQEAELGRARRIPTENLTAYDSLLRGWAYYNRLSPEGNRQARQMFAYAIELDPLYAAAYAFLGFTYLRDWIWQWSPDPQALERALALAQKAIALDDSVSAAHMLLSQAYLFTKQHELAVAEGERALALDPNNADGYARLGLILTWAGRPEEALGWVEQAMRLNPRYPDFYVFFLGQAYTLAGRYAEAIAAFQRLRALNPQFPGAYTHLAVIYSELGREEDARAEATAALRQNPHLSLKGVRQRLPFKNPKAEERFIAALRKAGLK